MTDEGRAATSVRKGMGEAGSGRSSLAAGRVRVGRGVGVSVTVGVSRVAMARGSRVGNCASAGAAVAVIFGGLSRKLIVETGSLVPVLVLLGVAVLVLSRLISNYHRTRATE